MSKSGEQVAPHGSVGLLPDVSAPVFLSITSEEAAIAEASGLLLGDLFAIERLHADDGADLKPMHREQLGAEGWLGLLIPIEYGGSGLTAVEAALFFRELGRFCGPIEVIGQLLAPLVAQDSQMQANLIAGKIGVALLAADGDKVRVLGNPDAELGLIANRNDASLVRLDTLDLQDRAGLDAATTMRVGSYQDLAPVSSRAGSAIWQLASIATSATLVGIAERALAMIVEYAKIRETFGRKIGSYQAVRHPCADMALRVEASKSQLWYAAASQKAGRGDADIHICAAKHLANEAARLNADTNIQLHGGIGITDEHDAHLLLKRALLLNRLFGSSAEALATVLSSNVEDIA